MSDSLLTKTAKACYRADKAPNFKSDWGSLSKPEQRNYEVMAAAALSVILREPIEELEENFFLPESV